ncbi:MAG: CoA transferase [Chloroflexi bacterium]|nr:CoA transferase [Chloroflexota bacterium]
MKEVTPEGCLCGIRVLDLADQKGAYCTRLLADLGADVIKVEPPSGDPTRNVGPFLHDEPDPEKSLYFFLFNAGKRGVTLDIESAGGQATLKELVWQSDVLVETFQPGYLDRLGLGYGVLKILNPGLIMTSITGFGQTGPWKDYKSSDIVALAASGLLFECGWPGLPPVRMAGAQGHNLGSAQAAAGTIMALYQRLKTGQGQHVDVSLQQSATVGMQITVPAYGKTGNIRGREGDERRLAAQGIFPCQDGFLDIAQLSAVSWWERFVKWLESENAAAELKEEKWEDPFYRTRPEAIEHVNEVLTAFFARNIKNELFRRGQDRGVVIGAVNTPEDIANDVQLKGRGFFVPVGHPQLGLTLQYPGAPVRLSETPLRISRPAPRLGEHNDEILLCHSERSERSERSRRILPGGGGQRPFDSDQVGGPGDIGRTDRDERPFAYPFASLRAPAQGDIPQTAGTQTGRLPFEGLRVVEFTGHVAGPMVGKAFADFGAQVISVENEEQARAGSSSRHPGAGAKDLTSLNQGNHFNKFNTNKLSVTLDMKKPGAMNIARRLIARADVVISNFVPGVLDRWGFSYEALRKIKPDIIFVTMPAFGTEGPYRDYRTLSWNLMAMCGLDYASRFPAKTPIRANPHSYPDTSSQPFHALIGALSALYHRAITGQGQHVELCQYESTLCFMETLIFEYLVNGKFRGPAGNRLDYAAPHGVYRCQGKDRWCAIAVFTEEEWRSFCRVTGKASLTADARFASLQDRLKNQDELDEIVNAWTQGRTDWEVMKLMQEAGVAAGVVENVEDLLNRDPQLKARNHWITVDHPEAGKELNEDWGFKLSAAPPLKWRHAPLLGEHNDLVLTQILGLSEAEVDQLIANGVVS